MVPFTDSHCLTVTHSDSLCAYTKLVKLATKLVAKLVKNNSETCETHIEKGGVRTGLL